MKILAAVFKKGFKGLKMRKTRKTGLQEKVDKALYGK